MGRVGRRLLGVFFLCALGFCASAFGQTVTHPFAGVTYIDRVENAPRDEHMHVVQIDLTAPGIRFHLTPHSGSLETTRQTTTDFVRAEHAQIGINAHFFVPFPSTQTEASLVGIAASDGDVYSNFEAPVQSYALMTNAPGLNIDRANHASIVHVNDKAELWNTVAGSAQIVTSGVKTIPVYGEGQLTPGGPGQYSNAKSWYDAVTARTAIGLSRDGKTLTLFTVDAWGGSAGMKVGEVADTLIRDYRVWDALNLDGGGSTSMAMEDTTTHEVRLVNTSSDNPAGRLVADSLAVFAAAGGR